MKKILIGILLASASYTHAQTINAEQIKKDNFTIRGNTLHQLMADTNRIATRRYVDSVANTSSFDTTSLSNRIDLKLDSVRRIPGTDTVVEYYDNGTQRFAFIDSVSGATIAAAAWALLGNTGTSPTTNFVGTTNNQHLSFRTNNSQWMQLRTVGQLWLRSGRDTMAYDDASNAPMYTSNMAIGDSAGILMAVSTPSVVDSMAAWNNIFLGSRAGKNCINCFANIGIGVGTLRSIDGFWSSTTDPFNIGGYENTAVGNYSAMDCISCYESTFYGAGAGQHTTTANGNSFLGHSSGNKNTTGNNNTFIGAGAGFNNTTSSLNTYVGNQAGFNATGNQNVMVGFAAGAANTSGFSNTIIGQAAMSSNTTGAGHVALGVQAGLGNTTGSENIFIGELAGDNVTTQSHQVFIGKGYVQGTYAADVLHTWISGVDRQDTTLNTLRLGGATHVAGDLFVSGKVTAVGGVDPPYISFKLKSHRQIKEYAEKCTDDVMQFYCSSHHRMEFYEIKRDRFFTIEGTEID